MFKILGKERFIEKYLVFFNISNVVWFSETDYLMLTLEQEKIDKQETEIINISGEMRGAEFFIIQETPSSSDSRKNRPGRKCLTFTKPELKNFLSISGIRYTGESKEKICEILYTVYTSNNKRKSY